MSKRNQFIIPQIASPQEQIAAAARTRRTWLVIGCVTLSALAIAFVISVLLLAPRT